MTSAFSIQQATTVLLSGGVIAYPTEGVYGLGCLPDYEEAVRRILAIKGRSVHSGLILIASDYAQLEDWLAPTPTEIKNISAHSATPLTWVVTARSTTPDWLTGGRDTLAVRVSDHPVVQALCETVASPLVSTSANRSGRPPARSALSARKRLGQEIDMVISGPLGGASGPSEIRMAASNRVIRPA
jgi:L-threonylcarbamoyladenylate synthase